MTLQKTLEERGKQYGAYAPKAEYMQQLKDGLRRQPSWTSVRGYQREALDMIMHKIARIVHGDPDYTDSWHDIAGYAQLVVEELNGRQTKASSQQFSEAVTGGPVIYPEVPIKSGGVGASEYFVGSPHGDEKQDGPYSDDYGLRGAGINKTTGRYDPYVEPKDR